jgi:hypothetical protein
MKKKTLLGFLTIALLAVVSIGFTSCGDDDSDGGVSVSAEQLYGKWVVTSQTVTENDGSTKTSSHSIGYYIIFNEDGTGTISNKHLFEDGIYGESFIWSVAGSKLKITDSSEDQYWTVTAISSNVLQLTWKDSDITEVTNFSKAN